MSNYTEPIEKLLTYGEPEPDTFEDWPNYLALGITTENTPELLRVIADPTLRTTDSEEEDPKYWAPVHAWRTIAQLHDASAAQPLQQLSDGLFDNDTDFSEWAIEELPDVYEAIGPAAIPPLIDSVTGATWSVETRINAMTSLSKLCTKYPEHREEVIATFTKQLENYAQNDAEINSYLILNLSDLKATETFPLIKTAFTEGEVDEFLISLELVEVSFGLRERLEPRFPKLGSLSSQSHVHHPTRPQSNSIPKANKNKKTKKAQAKASRKQNRRK